MIDATEGGAKIEGTIVQTLAETIEQECRGELDIYEIEKQIPPAFTPEQQKRLLKQLHGMKKEVADFTEKIDGMIKRQEALVDAMEKHLMPQEKLLEELRRINQQYEEISQETILNLFPCMHIKRNTNWEISFIQKKRWDQKNCWSRDYDSIKDTTMEPGCWQKILKKY